jgi:hypothetical protein
MAKKKKFDTTNAPSEDTTAYEPSGFEGGVDPSANSNMLMDAAPPSELDYTPPKNAPRFPGAANPDVKVEADDLLHSTPISQDYVPWGTYGMWGYYGFLNRNRPPFTYYTVREMLCDPRVIFGLWLIKGPIISKSKFEVECSRSDVTDYINKNLKRFLNGVIRPRKWSIDTTPKTIEFTSTTSGIWSLSTVVL